MTEVPWIDWYQSLAKPSWTPAPRTIGLIWQILYPFIIVTFGFVFVQAARGRLPLLVARAREKSLDVPTDYPRQDSNL